MTAIPLERRLPGVSSNPPGRQDSDIDPGTPPPLARRRAPRRPYSVLLPVGFAVPLALPQTRCALTAPFHPYRGAPSYLPRFTGEGKGGGRGGLFSVALSLGSPPPDVIRHRMSMEPGLSSPAAFRRLPGRPSGRLTRQGMGSYMSGVKPKGTESSCVSSQAGDSGGPRPLSIAS